MFRRYCLLSCIVLCSALPASAEDTRTDEAKSAARLATSVEAPAFEHMGEGVWILRERPEVDDSGKWFRLSITTQLPAFVAAHPDLRITAITPLPPRPSRNTASTTILNYGATNSPGQQRTATVRQPQNALPAVHVSEWLLVTESR